MSDIWLFFIFPFLLVFIKEKIFVRNGYIKRGSVPGRVIEWISALLIIIGILRVFAREILQQLGG